MARDIFSRFKRRARQFEATRGRPIAPSVTTRFLEAEIGAEQQRLGVEAERAERIAGQRELREQRREEIKAQRGANIVSGITGTATTAALIGETRLGQAAGRAAVGAARRVAPSVVGAVAPVPAGTLTGAGAPSAVTPTLTGTALPPTTAATPLAQVGAAAAPVLAGFAGAEIGKRVFGGEKGLIGKGETTQTIGTIGSAAAAGFLFGGPVGALIGAGTGVISDATVICTELTRQGYLSRRILELDGEYRKSGIDENTYAGYMRWAPYIVKGMQKSWIFTQLVRPFGSGWAHYTAHKIDKKVSNSVIGCLLYRLGVPVCRFLGRKGRK